MTETISFLLISPEGSKDIFGGPPSVVWNSVQIDYVQEGRQLEHLLQEIWKYIVEKIDKQGASIEEDYRNCAREGLLAFAEPPFKIATTQAPEKKR